MDRHITLEISDDARAWLAKEGYDPAFGARPLKRVVQREVADKLAIKLLDGSFEDEASIRVDVDAEGSSLVFVEARPAGSSKWADSAISSPRKLGLISR